MKFKTAESVTVGHPDKLCDYIADSILDAALKQDKNARVAVEVMLAHDSLFIGGEITADAELDCTETAHRAIRRVGYNPPTYTYKDIDEQSGDISQAVDKDSGEQGAGDQGIVYGYATIETLSGIPLAADLAHRLTDALMQEFERVPELGPDGKTQVTVAYDDDNNLVRIDTILVSVQHSEVLTTDSVRAKVAKLIREQFGSFFDLTDTKIVINPSGRFVKGGFEADTGLTGRKLMVDSYGGLAHHGGGAFSGKDPSKVDRSGAYMARYAANHIVNAGLADECEIAVAYAIGMEKPLAIDINAFGTEHFPIDTITRLVEQFFDFTPKGIEQTLHLTEWTRYAESAKHGHFGVQHSEYENDETPPWERIDRGLVYALHQKTDPRRRGSE